MTGLLLILCGPLAALSIGQTILVFGFVRALRRKALPLVDDQRAPRAVVILCLRGSDPFLPECLRCLFDQDYPRYDIRIVVDHADDPSRAVVEDTIRESKAAHVAVEVLREKRSTCSLKCSALVQVIQSLDDSYEFVAQLEAEKPLCAAGEIQTGAK